MKPLSFNPMLWKVSCVVLLMYVATGLAQASDVDLYKKIKHWIAEQHNIQTSSIQVQELDPRFHVPQCRSQWQFDQPFTQDNTVRARCISPGRQLFLNVQFPQTASVQKRNISAETMTSFVSLKMSLPRGTVLTEAHLTTIYKTHTQIHSDVFSDPQQVIGQELVRSITAGNMIRGQDVRPALMFRRGQEVLFTTRSNGGFQLTVKLEATEDGRLGQRVRLLNRESGRNVMATVVGPHSAQAL